MPADNPPPRKNPSNFMRQVALAMELPLVMAGSVVIGGGVGYLLDRYLQTAPILMVVGGVLGFAVGTWDIIRRLTWDEKRQGKGNGKNT
jgi:F0F1-type ATP synthase assembly protein I